MESAQQVNPNLRALAEDASRCRRWSEAAELWSQLSLLPDGSEEDFRAFGEAALEAKLFQLADTVLRTGLDRYPGNIWLGRLWALAAKWPGDYRDAAERFSRIRMSSDADFLAADHADCLFDSGQIIEAEHIVEEALRQFPQSRWLHLSWARIAARQGLADETARRWTAIERVLPVGPNPVTGEVDLHMLKQKTSSLLEAGAHRAAFAPLHQLSAAVGSRDVNLGPSTVGVVLLRDPMIIVSAVYSFEPVVRPIMEFRSGREEPVFFFFGSNMSLVFHSQLRELLPRQFHALSAEFPNAHITFMANEVSELILARKLGMRAELVNNNAFVDTQKYFILPHQVKTFDAVYNARFMPYKRHELAVNVQSLRLIMAGPKAGPVDAPRQAARMMFVQAEINDAELNHNEVVSAVNSAKCGLCLSANEGAMYAAIEYLLCGLPIVTTWNVGGRDWWLSGDYAIWCDPNPESVAASVKTIIERDIDPELIRETALQRIHRERLNFFDIVEASVAKRGGSVCDLSTHFAREFTDKANYQSHPLSYFLLD